jgi:hypothetical protein
MSCFLTIHPHKSIASSVFSGVGNGLRGSFGCDGVCRWLLLIDKYNVERLLSSFFILALSCEMACDVKSKVELLLLI